MSCLKGKSTAKKSKAKFVCEKCAAASEKKGELCRPEKLKPKKDKKQDDKKKDKAKEKK
jgi:hypothetical protein